jgi:hypothetical protein
MKVIYKTYLIDNNFYKLSSSGKKNAFGYVKCCFIKLVAIEKIALIDNDFYKSSSSGQKKCIWIR